MQSHATDFDFVPFFDFQYEKIIFNCQPSHFSPCSAVPVRGVKALQKQNMLMVLKTYSCKDLAAILKIFKVKFLVLFFITLISSTYARISL